ncbi:tyrosine-type recombinase/integrase [Nitrospira sp. Nam74]
MAPDAQHRMRYTKGNDQMETGEKKRERGEGMLYQRGNVWWIKYHFRGNAYRESSGSTVRKDALNLLKRRWTEMSGPQFHGPALCRTTFEDLARIIENDYRINSRRSLSRMLASLEAVRGFFGLSLAIDITLDRLDAYVAARLADNIALATIKNDLSILRRAFRLAQRAGKAVCPPFPILSVHNVRTGFFERPDFEAVRRHLPSALQPVVTFAYLTGWRTQSEILPLQWRQVDFSAGTVRLDPGTTKNDEGRVLPFVVLHELENLLTAQHDLTAQLERDKDVIIPWVFHRDGRRILDFRKAWSDACTRAGVPGRIPHDFRRTAVRNLERAGVPRSVAMKLTGHKTESVYRRYAIVSEADLADGMKKLATLHEADTKAIRSAQVRHTLGTISEIRGR